MSTRPPPKPPMACPLCGERAIGFLAWCHGLNALRTQCRHCDEKLRGNAVVWFGAIISVVALVGAVFMAASAVSADTQFERYRRLALLPLAGLLGYLVYRLGGYEPADPELRDRLHRGQPLRRPAPGDAADAGSPAPAARMPRPVGLAQALLIGMLGVAGLAGSLWMWGADVRLFFGKELTPGRITRIDRRALDDKWRSEYRATYEYTDNAGVRHTGQFERPRKQPPDFDAPVEVAYAPGDPAVSRLAADLDARPVWIVSMCGLMIVLSAFHVVWRIRLRNSDPAASPPADR